jgi:hypothetical protein
MKNEKPLLTLRGWPRRIVEARGICSVAASSSRLHRHAILPRGADPVLVADLRADGWLVTICPTDNVQPDKGTEK